MATTAIDANAADKPLADTIFLPCVFSTASVDLAAIVERAV
jgi:hypothetical protein